MFPQHARPVLRRPAGARWSALSAAVLATALTAQKFSSFKHCAASGVPLLVTAALLLDTPLRRRVALPVAAAGLFACTVAA